MSQMLTPQNNSFYIDLLHLENETFSSVESVLTLTDLTKHRTYQHGHRNVWKTVKALSLTTVIQPSSCGGTFPVKKSVENKLL